MPFIRPCLVFLLVFICFNYGGVRSPDCEVSFRTALALSEEGRFGLSHDLERWKRFGLPKGVDDYHYSLFGPLQPIALVPLVKVANLINGTGWYEEVNLPTNHYLVDISHQLELEQGVPKVRIDLTPSFGYGPKDDAVRFISSHFNALIGTLTIWVFMMLLLAWGASYVASVFAGCFLAVGSIWLSYTGTMFTEPLTALCVLAAVYFHARLENGPDEINRQVRWQLIAAGGFLGLAVASHITGILFAPFLGLHVLSRFSAKTRIQAAIMYSLPLAFLLMLLGWYNHARFGMFWETGRNADPEIHYAGWISPFEGLWGLTLSWGRGLIPHAPIVVLALCYWRRLRNALPKLCWFLLAALIFRVLFLAARGDWFGGSCVGPRLLIPALPLFLLPLGPLFTSWFKQPRFIWITGLVLVLCFWQQLYLALGESFVYYQQVETLAYRLGVDIRDQIFILPSYSPIFNILDDTRGPWLFQNLSLTNYQLWLVLGLIGSACIGLFTWRVSKKANNPA